MNGLAKAFLQSKEVVRSGAGIYAIALLVFLNPSTSYSESVLSRFLHGEEALFPEGSLHYEVADGDVTKPGLLFIHGSPGEWRDWKSFMGNTDLKGFGFRLSVDRPGFGHSKNMGLLGLRREAEIFSRLIPPGNKVVVVGHFMGAPIAVWMAVDHPEKVLAAVSVAGSLSSQRELPRWYNRLAEWLVIRNLLPPEFITSNREMLQLSSQLKELEQALPRLKVPVFLVQGSKDFLVEPATVDDWEKLGAGAPLRIDRLKGEDHFLHWRHPSRLVGILELLIKENF